MYQEIWFFVCFSFKTVVKLAFWKSMSYVFALSYFLWKEKFLEIIVFFYFDLLSLVSYFVGIIEGLKCSETLSKEDNRRMNAECKICFYFYGIPSIVLYNSVKRWFSVRLARYLLAGCSSFVYEGVEADSFVCHCKVKDWFIEFEKWYGG